VAINIAQELKEYATGLTLAVLLSILELKVYVRKKKGGDKDDID
jgi:hypothetical protein